MTKYENKSISTLGGLELNGHYRVDTVNSKCDKLVIFDQIKGGIN